MDSKDNLREIKWIPSYNNFNNSHLLDLKNRMKNFYESNSEYYENIDFANNIWSNDSALPQLDIIKEANNSTQILEIGCGKANILLSNEELAVKYTGIDFSPSLIEKNKKNFSSSKFEILKESEVFPVSDNVYDLVFSHFVIEHTIFPQLFLDECFRVLKPGGKLIILCPNFSLKFKLYSQRVGFSQGPGKSKFNEGKIFDSFVTGFDNKVRMPLKCSYYGIKSAIRPQFYINSQPTCFTDKFFPDIDAVYFTNQNEIKKYLESKIKWIISTRNLVKYCNKNKLIYLKGIKIL